VADETRPVRESEGLDWPAVVAYLREALPRAHAFATRHDRGKLDRPPVIRQFPGGHSNLTYLLRFDDVEIVLRRPPLGPVPPRAHDMAREARWLGAVHEAFPLAPAPLLLCEDLAVAGTVFYVMERRSGLVIRHEEPPAVAGREEVRRGISEALVDTLAALHAVDVTTEALAGLGKPAGFVARQVDGWIDRWHRSATTPIQEMEALAEWLRNRLPPEPSRPSVVHGDFKLDNVVLASDDPRRLVAVLDWEMAALGDPLVDVGIFLAYWVPLGAPGEADALSTVTDRPGWLPRDEVLGRYEAVSGRDLRSIRFYETFALFKLAVVIQQIYVRYVRGQTDDARFAALGSRVERLAHRATGLAALG
jgi:aminoglycoside phosphotransferase (APT) family kinase protein